MLLEDALLYKKRVDVPAGAKFCNHRVSNTKGTLVDACGPEYPLVAIYEMIQGQSELACGYTESDTENASTVRVLQGDNPSRWRISHVQFSSDYGHGNLKFLLD